MAQPGSAPVLVQGVIRFESCCPDHLHKNNSASSVCRRIQQVAEHRDTPCKSPSPSRRNPPCSRAAAMRKVADGVCSDLAPDGGATEGWTSSMIPGSSSSWFGSKEEAISTRRPRADVTRSKNPRRARSGPRPTRITSRTTACCAGRTDRALHRAFRAVGPAGWPACPTCSKSEKTPCSTEDEVPESLARA